MDTLIFNFTQHQAQPSQLAAGVVDLNPEMRKVLSNLLTLDAQALVADPVDVCYRRVEYIVDLAQAVGAEAVMIGGQPTLMRVLAGRLHRAGIRPLEAVGDRVSVDEPQPDGTTKKVVSWKHIGFVPATIGLGEL